MSAKPTRNIPLSVPEISGNEWSYVKDCIDTNWVSSAGSYVDKFENMVADYIGVRYAVATSSGTAALHLALLCADVGPEDEVVMPSMTFIAPANAVRYVGAYPVFIDSESNYWQMDVEILRDFIENHCVISSDGLTNSKTGRKVKAILPVHILGHPVDMDPLLEIANKYGITVIEDATESLGASYRTKKIGSIGKSSCFSFNGNKLMTTGGGGMLVTDDLETASLARHLSTQAKDDEFEYKHSHVGYNYRLTNIAAAMGCAQMEKINELIAAKISIARHYEDCLSGVSAITLMPEADWVQSVFWMYTILVNDDGLGLRSRHIMKELSHHGIQTRPLWEPMHMSDVHKNCDNIGGVNSENLYRHAISLPCSVGLPKSDQDIVISNLKRIINSGISS